MPYNKNTIRSKANLFCIFCLLSVCVNSQNFTLRTGSGAEIGGNKAGGAVWADFDNDGDLDVIVNTSQNNVSGRTRLLQSDGAANPNFTDVTTTLASGLTAATCERSVLWGDINNDGHIDFVRNTSNLIEFYINRGTTSTPNYQFGVGVGQTPNFRVTDLDNNGNNCGGGDGLNSEGLAFLDYNNDGWLDLVIENADCGVDILENQQLDALATINTQLNDGGDNDGVVENSGEALGNVFMQQLNNNPALGLATDGGNGDYMASGDYDNDGYVDFIVRKPSDATALFGTKLYTNDGDGTFTSNTTIPTNNAATDAQNANKGGAIFCDFDLDGDLDIFWSDAGTNQIWLQTASRTFTATAKPAVPGGSDIDGCACADVDGDGDIDLFLGNNGANSYLYTNTTTSSNSVADLSFTLTNINVNDNAEGVNLVDYDDDGDYDIYVNVAGGNNQIWENDFCDLGACDFLKVFIEDCIDGTSQTRPVVGASITIRDDMGMIISGAQSGSTAAGHGAQNPPTTIFSLPDLTSDYTIDITFPEKNGVIESYSYAFNGSEVVDNTLTLLALNGTDGSSCETESVLPVELLFFSSRALESSIQLDWATASEENNDFFVLARSSDGVAFSELARIAGNGTSSERNTYTYLDQNPLIGANYYRLTQVDFNGQSEQFEVLLAFFEAEEEVIVFPNPVTDKVTIQFGSQFSRTTADLVISSLSGKKVWSNQLFLTGSRLELYLNSIPSGTYLLEMTNQTSSHQSIFIKR